MTVFVAQQNRGRPDRIALNHLLSLHRKAIMSPGIVTKLIFVHHMSMKRFRTQDHRRQGRWKRLYGVIVPLLPCHDRLQVPSDVVGRRNWSASNLLRIASSAMVDMLRTGTLAETLGEEGPCGLTLPKGGAGPGLAPVPDRDDHMARLSQVSLLEIGTWFGKSSEDSVPRAVLQYRSFPNSSIDLPLLVRTAGPARRPIHLLCSRNMHCDERRSGFLVKLLR